MLILFYRKFITQYVYIPQKINYLKTTNHREKNIKRIYYHHIAIMIMHCNISIFVINYVRKTYLLLLKYTY